MQITDAQVHIYFSELYQYGVLTWSRSRGYTFQVLLKGVSPPRGGAPLPEPTAPGPPPTPPTTSP